MERTSHTLGAFTSLAIPYRVRVAMYWSELAAEMVKIKIQLRSSVLFCRNIRKITHALMMDGRTLIPAD